MFYKGKDSLNPSLMQHVVFHKDPGNRHHSKAYFVKLQTSKERKLTVLGHLEAEAIDNLLEIPSVSLSASLLCKYYIHSHAFDMLSYVGTALVVWSIPWMAATAKG